MQPGSGSNPFNHNSNTLMVHHSLQMSILKATLYQLALHHLQAHHKGQQEPRPPLMLDHGFQKTRCKTQAQWTIE